ncbi:MAG: hypothetical protein HKP42_12860 [Maribacter sp.]|nr:hypothetical protein [Maribacter sp.]
MKITTRFKVSIILAFCCSALSSYGQARVQAIQNGANTELYFNRAVMAPTYNEVIGSPYLYEDFLPAKVNNIPTTHFIRFNVFDNNIEYKGQDNIIYAMAKSYDYVIELLDGSNRIFETHAYMDEKKGKLSTFFEKIYNDDNFGLYLKEMIDYTPVKLAKTSFEPNRPAKFTKIKGTYYFQNLNTKSKELLKLPKREKLFLKQFDAHDDALKKFIKKEGLSISKEIHLIRILEFYFAQSGEK